MGARKPKKSAETMVSLAEVTQKLVPLAKEVKEQSKRHIGLISTGRLTIIASEILRLLDLWASNDTSVRRVNGRVVPPKRPV
jgi:hypothetical protein